MSGVIGDILETPRQSLKIAGALFRIDDSAGHAAVATARANVATAQAALTLAQAAHDRAVQLEGSGYSAAEVDSARASLAEAQAALDPSNAVLAYAQIELSLTTLRIFASYTGPAAETVENSVTSVIEDGMTGLDGLTRMTSSSSAGVASISLTFDVSIDPDMAQVENKLQLVQSQLPGAVTNRGVSVSRSTSSILMAGGLRPSAKPPSPR